MTRLHARDRVQSLAHASFGTLAHRYAKLDARNVVRNRVIARVLARRAAIRPHQITGALAPPRQVGYLLVLLDAHKVWMATYGSLFSQTRRNSHRGP